MWKYPILFLILFATLSLTPEKDRLRQDFINPPLSMKSRPLWFWNAPLSREQTLKVLVDSKKVGYYGLGILPSYGMTPDYMTPEFLDQYKMAVEIADSLRMKLYLYDEYYFPSGMAGGLLVKQYPEAVSKRLDMELFDFKGPGSFKQPLPAGTFMGAVAMNASSFERIDLSERVAVNHLSAEIPLGDWKVMIFTLNPDSSSGRNHVDYLSPEAVNRFIDLTYEKFYQAFPEHFGTTIDYAFYDEPCLRWVDGARTWTGAFNTRFAEKYGFSPVTYYPALWFDIGPETVAARNLLLGYRAELYATGFPKTINDWCRDHNILLTGHVDQEEIVNPVAICGDLMKAFKYQDIPAVDAIFYYGRSSLIYKVISSAANNYDRPVVATECYGATGKMNVNSLYKEAMDQFAKGINLMEPHAVWYSEVIDIQPDLSPSSKKFGPDLPAFNEYIGRLQTMLQGGRHVADIAILYPIASLQGSYHFGPGDPGMGGIIPSEADYLDIGEMLSLDIRRDFTFIHPEILDEKCLVKGSEIELQNKINQENFDVFILPGSETIQLENIRKIKNFFDQGGAVIATSMLPWYSAETGKDEEVRTMIKSMFGDNAYQMPGLASISASCNWNTGGYIPAYAIDKRMETGWKPSEGKLKGEWLEIGLGGEQTIGHIKILTNKDSTLSYTVWYREGNDWVANPLFNKPGNAPVKTSAIRIVLETGLMNKAVLSEVEILDPQGRDILAGLKPYFRNENAKGGRAWFIPAPNATILETVLDETDIDWDVRFEGDLKVTDGNLTYLHKQWDGRDVYFFANSSATPVDVPVILKGNLQLQAWNPQTGAISACESTSEKQGKVAFTRARLKLKPVESIFWVTVQSSGPDKKAYQTIESKKLKVTIDPAFPRIVQYNWKSTGDVFYGQEDDLSLISINGESYEPEVSFTKSGNSADYQLNLPRISVTIHIQVKVTGNEVGFNVTKIEENGSFRVSTFDIPSANLISIRSTQNEASFAGAKMFTAVKGTGDVFIPLTEVSVIDSIPNEYLYGIVHSDRLAASIWTNSVTEKSDNGRIQKQTTRKDGYIRTGLWSGSWIYRAQGMTKVDPLPSVKLVITDDVNGDKRVDWQDGAIAYRTIMNNPVGSDAIPQMVVQRIPMNFASQATNPFTKTLDETKRIFLNTDGLGQYVILKGYGSEGHDSGHPDFGEIGARQGGAKDMEMLCKAARKYNAFMGVHINGTESYPEAKAFNDSLVNKTKRGWDWLDASYYIDKRYDATSNNRMQRLQSLKDQVPSLSFIYNDVWYARGSWDSRKFAREINSLGLILTTEFPTDHEYDAVWNHWAVDYDYGGKDIKGFSSQIVRFIRNHQKDTWIARHPLLGGTEMKDFEGWQGRNNFDSCIWMTFHTGLPTKFLQHFPIIRWEENSILFEHEVEAKLVDGKRVITREGRTVLNGEAYLLPWNPLVADKLYYWNSSEELTTWTIPAEWSRLKSVVLYKLTDQGREFVQNLKVVNGQISIRADKNTPYVVYKKAVEPPVDIFWGEGTLMKDPGFNSGNLKFWTVEGTGASVVRNKIGQYELLFSGDDPASVSQNISGLEPGTWYASVYVATSDRREATLSVADYGGAEVTALCNSSLWKNYIAADSKSDTNMQRMYLFFTVPEGQSSATLSLKAGKGASDIIFDDVRIARSERKELPDSIYFAEDFEHIPDGLYPFIKGPAGGINDPRTHLAELHEPYTQRGWNGKMIDDVISGNWSIKVHGEPAGLMLQTIPQTVRFIAGKTYTVSFKYEAMGPDYALVFGEDDQVIISVTLSKATIPTDCTFSFVAGKNDNSWFGITKLNDSETDMVLDDLVITVN
jgi:endo-alpha-N-acetylgalactosaminidase